MKPPSTSVAAVILAAGASTRMGRVKARLRWNGRSFLECAWALAHSCNPIVVVTGAHELADLVPPPILLVRHRRWEQGQLSSLQTGLRVVLSQRVAAPTFDGVLVLTVDRPRIDPATITALHRAIATAPGQIWQPRYHGRSGHPIYYPAEVVDELLTLDPISSARSLLQRHDLAARRQSVDVDDPGVVDNIDTPEDFDGLKSGPAG